MKKSVIQLLRSDSKIIDGFLLVMVFIVTLILFLTSCNF